MDIKENLKEGKSLLLISSAIIIFISVLLYFLLKIEKVKPFIDGFISLVGFSATIYSVVLTILLFNFLNMSKAKFWLNSKQFVERNQKEIIERVIALSNLVGQLVKNKKANVEQGISEDLIEHFHYIKTINDKYTNEQTMLNQCKETFKVLVDTIEKSGLITAENLDGIELEKLVKIRGYLIELTISLDTIFDNKE